jgi:VWFA-related protein
MRPTFHTDRAREARAELGKGHSSLGVLLAVVSTAAAGSEIQPPPRFSTEAELVYVDVSATDKQGRPIRNLDAADFAVFDDGHSTPVVAFRSPRAEKSADRGLLEAPHGMARLAGGESPLTFVVYVDNWNLNPSDRKGTLSSLGGFLKEQLAVGDARVMVLAAMQRSQVQLPLTSDAEKALAALAVVGGMPTQGQVTRAKEREVIETLRSLLGAGPGSCEEYAGLTLLQAPVRLYAQERVQELSEALAELDTLIQALGTLRGSKALFYVSAGFEQRPAIDLFHQVFDICPHASPRAILAPMEDYDMAAALRRLAARANAARVTVYPIDALSVRDGRSEGFSQADSRFIPSHRTALVRAENLKAGQWILAEETGGTPVFGSNGALGALRRLGEQLRSEYVLGFAPAHDPEGHVHDLRVEVFRKGVRLRHRPSYFHRPQADVGTSRTVATLVAGLEEDTLGAEIWVGPVPGSASAAAGRGATVRIGVPVRRLAARQTDQGPYAQLRVIIAVRKAMVRINDESVEVRHKLIDVPLGMGDSERSSDVRQEFRVDLPLSLADADLAVGVLDVLSERATYRRLEARVGVR